MNKYNQKIGFTYFSSPEYLVKKELVTWLKAIKQLGSENVIFQVDFMKAIPEDVFMIANDFGLNQLIHYNVELPSARSFNELSILLDAYAKWGVSSFILGDKPNKKSSWPVSGWRYENLVEHYLDRFIPLASYAVKLGVRPVLAPLQPGGDYWDTAFLDLLLDTTLNRELPEILENLVLSSYGYTFNNSLFWGMGGPEKWCESKPYHTPDGHEDQLGFHNFEWIQSICEQRTGEKKPVMILDAGNSGLNDFADSISSLPGAIHDFLDLFNHPQDSDLKNNASEALNDPSLLSCFFNLNTLNRYYEGDFTVEQLKRLFSRKMEKPHTAEEEQTPTKLFSHYLLLPNHVSGVSDVVLNKVRPIIKKLHPTVGFSLFEASLASKVSVFPDPLLFPPEELNALRSMGCTVEILPDSGMEIATYLQEA